MKETIFSNDVFKHAGVHPGGPQHFFPNKGVKRVEAAPGNITLSLLANSFLFGLGFTAVIDFEEYLRLVAFNADNTKLLLNRKVTSHGKAAECIEIKYFKNGTYLSRALGLTWTCFYSPDNKWWQEKTISLLTNTRRPGN